MRIVHATELLQAVPDIQTAAGLADQALVDNDFLQHVVGIDHCQTGHLVRQTLALAGQALVDRDQAAVPLGARHACQVRGVAAITGNKIDHGEGQILRHSLVRFVLVAEGLDRPILSKLRVGVKAKAGGPVRPGRRVVTEGRESARLHRCRRHQIGWQTGGFGTGTGEHAEECRAAVAESAQQAIARAQQVGTAGLQDIDFVQPHRHAGEFLTAQTGCQAAVAVCRDFQDVVYLRQHLDRQTGGQDLHQLGLLGCIHLRGIDADQIVGELCQFLRVQTIGAILRKQGVVPRFAVLAGNFQLGHGNRLGQRHQPGAALAIRAERFGTTGEQERVGPGGAGFATRRNELLRVQGGQQIVDAFAPALRKSVLWQCLGKHARHRIKVKGATESGAHGGLQIFCAASGSRAFVIGLQNV